MVVRASPAHTRIHLRRRNISVPPYGVDNVVSNACSQTQIFEALSHPYRITLCIVHAVQSDFKVGSEARVSGHSSQDVIRLALGAFLFTFDTASIIVMRTLGTQNDCCTSVCQGTLSGVSSEPKAPFLVFHLAKYSQSPHSNPQQSTQNCLPSESLSFIFTTTSSYIYPYHFNFLNKAMLQVIFYLYVTLISAYAACCMLHCTSYLGYGLFVIISMRPAKRALRTTKFAAIAQKERALPAISDWMMCCKIYAGNNSYSAKKDMIVTALFFIAHPSGNHHVDKNSAVDQRVGLEANLEANLAISRDQSRSRSRPQIRFWQQKRTGKD